MAKGIVCYECKCSLGDCNDNELLNNDIRCQNCIKEICCCTTIHTYKLKKTSLVSNLTFNSKTRLFFTTTKSMYSAALGIEILCIMAAEIGENIGLYTFGFNLIGISFAYIIGYALAGFTTFMTILGRYSFSCCSNNIKIESCCSILEQLSCKGFLPNMLLTFKSFINGFRKISGLRNQSELRYILKTSLILLITAESACILTAETIGIIFYNYSIVLSIPLALLVGALTIVIIEAYKTIKAESQSCCDCNDD
ncbi:MAG: hypothetical protein ACRD8K_10615 [Nitrososphaeraceae archaeon]